MKRSQISLFFFVFPLFFSTSWSSADDFSRCGKFASTYKTERETYSFIVSREEPQKGRALFQFRYRLVGSERGDGRDVSWYIPDHCDVDIFIESRETGLVMTLHSVEDCEIIRTVDAEINEQEVANESLLFGIPITNGERTPRRFADNLIKHACLPAHWLD